VRGIRFFPPNPDIDFTRVYGGKPYIPTLPLAKRLKRCRKISNVGLRAILHQPDIPASPSIFALKRPDRIERTKPGAPLRGPP
jgi:hypothetical protein